ncbi:MAG: hypothetical protein WC364_15325 [Eubacteriales bacterium]|jgi:hypothetical protein
MHVSDTIRLVGRTHLVFRHKNGEIFAEIDKTNTITTVGKQLLAKLMAVDVGETGIDYIAIGVGTPSATALGSESTTNGGTRRGAANVTGTNETTTLTGDTARFITTFTFTGALVLTEAGLFNGAGADTMLASQTFAAVTTADTDTLQLTWDVKVA